jgi:hypothetical protein
MKALRVFPLLGWSCALLALVTAGGHFPAAGPPPRTLKGPPLIQLGADKAELRTFRLKSLPAAEAARMVRDLLGERVGARGPIRMTVHERANALVVLAGGTDLRRLETILREIDSEDKTNSREVPVDGEAEAYDQLEEVLKTMFAHRPQTRFHVNRRFGVVVLSGTEKDVEDALKVINVLGPWKKHGPRPTDVLEVRLFWLESGQGAQGTALPDVLKDVVADLRKRGLDKPRLVTQVSVNAVPDVQFEVSGAATARPTHHLTVSGKVTSTKSPFLALPLTVTVQQSGWRGSRPVVSLRTQVAVFGGGLAVLGVVPGEKLTSAFVVQVHRKPRDE